jgi:hypothetical protein
MLVGAGAGASSAYGPPQMLDTPRTNDGLNRWVMTLMKSGRAAPYRCDRKRLVVIIVFLCPVTYNLQKLLALLLSLWTLCNWICLAYMRCLLIFPSLLRIR